MGHWPEGVDQRQTLVGSVIRAKPHDGESSPAVYVASFIAVKQWLGETRLGESQCRIILTFSLFHGKSTRGQTEVRYRGL